MRTLAEGLLSLALTAAALVAGGGVPRPDTTVFVPIPRLCRVVSASAGDDITVAGESVAAGRVYARLRLRQTGSGGLPADFKVTYEPLPESARPERESLLWARQNLPVPSAVEELRGAGDWRYGADTSLCQFFGGPAPHDFRLGELARMPLDCDVVIGAAVGGWSVIPLEQADDVYPTVCALRDALRAWGLRVLVVPCYRAPAATPAVILNACTEFVGLHHQCSGQLARDIEELVRAHPRVRVVLIGLSQGATLLGQAFDRIQPEARSRVCAILLGQPFYTEPVRRADPIRVELEDDPMVEAECGIMLATIVSAYVRFAADRRVDPSVKLGPYFEIPSHCYDWATVGPVVLPFLREMLAPLRVEAQAMPAER